MSENALMKYLRTDGFNDLIKPNISGTILENFSMSDIEDSYNKVLGGEEPPPPKGGEIPELNFDEKLKELERAVEKVQKKYDLDENQMKSVLNFILGIEDKPLSLSYYKNTNITKNASASWVKDYFLSILPIGDELISLVYILMVIKDKSHIEDFINEQKESKRKNIRIKLNKNIAKIKTSDFKEVFNTLSPEGGNELFDNFKNINNAMKYAGVILTGLVFGHVFYVALSLVSIKEIAKITTLTQDEFDAMYDILISELLNDALITAVLSFLATPLAAMALQIRKLYKLQKWSSRIKGMIKLRSKMYKLLESKPCRIVLSINSPEAIAKTVNIFKFDSMSIVADSLKRIRKKLGIKVKKASFNNLLIKKLANFLEKNNLTEELRILKEEIL